MRRAYLAVLANRPLDAIANAETMRRLQLGLDNIVLLQRVSARIADVGARRSVPPRLRAAQGRSTGSIARTPPRVTFLTPTLFRASIPLPAEVPVGTYEVDVKLFADGAMIARTTSAFEIDQGRLRAVRRLRRARPRPSLRPRHRHDGADDRLDRERGVPARLSVNPAGSAGRRARRCAPRPACGR